MLSQQQINQFSQRAKSAGYTNEQILAEIERKRKEEEEKDRLQTPTSQALQFQEPGNGIFREKPTGIMGTVTSVSDFLFPRASGVAREAGATLGLRQNLPEAQRRSEELHRQSRELIARARGTADPEEKKRLLTLSRQVSEQASQLIEGLTGEFERTTGIPRTTREQPSYLAKGFGAAGEAGTFFVPVGKLPKGAGLVQRILQGGKVGATVGAIHGLTTPEDISLAERGKRGLQAAGVGGITGAAVTTAFEVPRMAVKKTLESYSSMVKRLFRIGAADRAKFRKSTGDMDFVEEIITRDGKAVAGKSYEEMLEHFGNRQSEAMQKVDDIVTQSDEVVDKKKFIKQITAKIANLQPGAGNVKTRSAINELRGVLSDLRKIKGESIPLEQVNTIKKQLQSAGSAAFSPSGKATIASNALAWASGLFKEAVEEKAPQVKEANKMVQLYHLARTGIERTGDREANKLSNDVAQKFFQVLPTIFTLGAGYGGYRFGGAGGGVGAAIASQLLIGGVGAGRVKYFSPEVQSQLANSFKTVLSSQGVKNADKVATRITQEISKLIARRATTGVREKGILRQPEEQVETTPGIPQPGEPQGVGIEGPEFAETIQIRNKKTGEIKTIRKEEISQYRLPAPPGTEEGGIPSKEQILSAMVLDLEQSGGKNLSKLNTFLIAYDKVYGKSTMSALEKSKVQEATGALNLVDTIEDGFNELQQMGLAAERGGLGRLGGLKGYAAAITQEGTSGAAAAAYSDTKDAFLSRLARASGEKGVLTDYDINRIRKALPKFTDTPETVTRKLNLVRSIISGAIETKLSAPIGEEELTPEFAQ